jgi:hypothetical protein
VGAVEQHSAEADPRRVEHLEPARPAHLGEPASDALLGKCDTLRAAASALRDRVEHAERDRRVLRLVCPEQPDPKSEELAVGRHGVHGDAVPILVAEHGVIRVPLARAAELHADLAASRANRREAAARRARDRDVPGLDDRGLLAADRAERGPEDRLVVLLDVRDRRDAEVEDVCGVEPPAEPDLDDDEVHPPSRELGDRGRGQRFELGRRSDVGGHAIDCGQHALDGRSEVRSRDRLAVDGDALAIADEVRLRHRPDRGARRDEHRADHRHHRALAVRPADERSAQVTLRITELGHQPSHSVETHADPESPALGQRGDGVRVGQRIGQSDPSS